MFRLASLGLVIILLLQTACATYRVLPDIEPVSMRVRELESGDTIRIKLTDGNMRTCSFKETEHEKIICDDKWRGDKNKLYAIEFEKVERIEKVETNTTAVSLGSGILIGIGVLLIILLSGLKGMRVA